MSAAPAIAQTSRLPTTGATAPSNNFRGPPLPNSPTLRPKSPTSADIDRKLDQARKWADQKKRDLNPDLNRVRTKTGAPRASQPPPFNAASAPPPEECLKAFIAAGRTATQMEQLMKFLPQRQMEALKAQQANYDPKNAASAREWHRKQNPKITDEELNHITGPPYNFELKFHKSLANEIVDILSAKVEGNKANLVVSTSNGATVNGEHYPYGKADVEMVGEGNYWKLSRYNPSIVVYKDLPTTP